MNTLIAMTVRACVMGIDATEDDDRRGRAKYLAILENLAGELDRGDQAFAHPGAPAPEVRAVPAAEMHQSEVDMLRNAGFEDVGELLSAYNTQSDVLRHLRSGHTHMMAEVRRLESVPKTAPLSAAQIERLYQNSPELTDRASSLHMSIIQFKNLVGLVERAHGILKED